MNLIKFLFAGTLFGILITKAEVISWFRIQKMFHLEEPYMFLILGSAVITGAIVIQIMKRINARNSTGDEIVIPQKKFNKGYIFGGIIFGMGWFVTGTCPGPIAALIGGGHFIVIFTFIGALLGTFVYSYLRPKLPH